MDKPFELLMRVRYGECDAQQVVFNARYADYVDVAITEYFRVLFGGFKELLKQGLDNQVVRLAIDWRSPARFDDVLAITVETTAIGNTSFTLTMQMSVHGQERLVATAAATYVMVTTPAHKKTPVPEPIRSLLQAGAAGVLVNQAGVAAGSR